MIVTRPTRENHPVEVRPFIRNVRVQLANPRGLIYSRDEEENDCE